MIILSKLRLIMISFHISLLMPFFASAQEGKVQDTPYVIELFGKIFRTLGNIWEYTLFRTDGQSFALSNLILGIIFFILGLRLARYLTNIIHNKFLKIISIEDDVSNALAKVFHYIIVVVITMMVLDFAHVPLTVFTFIGGALAISFGLAAQHIINNFMSGIIIMMENPIKVGDLIEVENTLGRVANIGFRCIDVKTKANKNVLIPHSIILQNELINWTSHDQKVRLETVIRIAYDESLDTKKIERIFLDAVKKNKDLMIEPVPQVLITSFDHNIVIFEVNFWLNMANKGDRRKIISDINHALYGAVRKNKLQLAIPSRKMY